MENFINFGLYREPDADRLKQALENYGIPVKVVSSGTTSGSSVSTVQVGAPALTFLVPESKIESAEKIREELQVVRLDTPSSVRSPYDTANRYLFIISFLSFFLVWVGIFSDQLSQSFHTFFINQAQGVFFAGYGLAAVGLVTFLSAVVLFIYRFSLRKYSREEADQKNKNETRQ